MDVVGENPSNSEMNIFRSFFVDTYDRLRTGRCDPLNRDVVTASFNFHRKQEVAGQVMTTFKVDVEGTCVGCEATDTVLFLGETAQKRSSSELSSSIQQTNDYESFWNRRAQQSSCVCTPGMPPGPASEALFVDQYNDAIQPLIQAGLFRNLGQVTNVYHLFGQPCGRINTFSVEVIAEFGAPNPETIATPSEVAFLEESFAGTYNILQESGCDQQFRTVTQTTFVLESVRRRLDHRQLARVTAAYKGGVNGTCRRCSSNTTLFARDTAAGTRGRRRRHLAISRSDPRLLQSSDTCQCSSASIAESRFLSPNVEAFVFDYDGTVQAADELTNIDGVEGVVELDPTPTPTFAPTRRPTRSQMMGGMMSLNMGNRGPARGDTLLGRNEDFEFPLPEELGGEGRGIMGMVRALKQKAGKMSDEGDTRPRFRGASK